MTRTHPSDTADGSSDSGEGTASPSPAGALARSLGVDGPRGRNTAVLVGVVVSFVATAVLAAAVVASRIDVPYYALRPGSIRDSQGAIEIVGAPVRASDGTIYYTTVSVRGISALEYLTSSFDSDVELVHEDEILGDRDPDENREFNLQLMNNAQQDATALALEVLGYEIDETLQGYMVHETMDGFVAAELLAPGDVITEIDGESIDSFDALQAALDTSTPGDEVEVVVEHHPELLDDADHPDSGTESGDADDTGECGVDGTYDPNVDGETRTLELGADPDDSERAIMGVLVSPEYDFPVDICFDTGEVGGPSAGLAFTMTLIDMLSTGDLTGGLDVAVTGSIHPDGSVGPVGGTPQKMLAARRSGVDVFLVPASTTDADLELVHARSGDVEVIEVATLDEAVDALVELGGDPVTDLDVEE